MRRLKEAETSFLLLYSPPTPSGVAYIFFLFFNRHYNP
jgi:hypothetical protein